MLLSETIHENIAIEFASQLKRYMDNSMIEEVNRRNKTDEYIGCCATHDFCDPNVCMDDAFTKIMGREWDFMSEVDTSLVVKAWDTAKENNFYIN